MLPRSRSSIRLRYQLKRFKTSEEASDVLFEHTKAFDSNFLQQSEGIINGQPLIS